MSWNYWPADSLSNIQDYRVWLELQDAINERCDAVGIGRLTLPIASGYGGMFRLDGIRAVCDRINALLPMFCDHAAIGSGTSTDFMLYSTASFDLLNRKVVDCVDGINELFAAVDKMRWSFAGNGVQTDALADSIDGDKAQRTGTPHFWSRPYNTKALAMSAYPSQSTFENWDGGRFIHKETGLTWAMGTIFAGAVLGTYPGYLTNKWYGLFDADWGYVTSDRELNLFGGIISEVVLYAKLFKSFWTDRRFDWKHDGPSFYDYQYMHPGGLIEGCWGEFGKDDTWEGLKPVSAATYNKCIIFPGEQNWLLRGPQYYIDNEGGVPQYDSKWVIKWHFDKAT